MNRSSTAEAIPQPLDPSAHAAILDGLPTALIVADHDGSISYANERAEALLGSRSSRLIGRPVNRVLAPMEQLREIADADAATHEDDRPSITIRRNGGDPREIGIQLSEVATDATTSPSTLIVFQEIGHLIRLRSERDHLLRLATVGAVLPTILHELKNPLASVTSAVELLVEEAKPGRFQDDLHAILTEVRRMKLGFEGIGIAGRELRSVRNSAIDLALRNAAQVFHARAERDGIELHCEIPNLPLLPLDDAVIRAIAFNLINNALYACDRGDSIRVSARLENGGDSFVLDVADTGTGMSAETLVRSTELFFTTKNSGSGIGLALCKNTLETAGGELVITSELGVGTTMTARVPSMNQQPR
jgi:PAS domain S-box-containing protein